MTGLKLDWDANIPTELFRRLFPRRRVGKQPVILQRTASDNLWIVLDRRNPNQPFLRLYGLERLAREHVESPSGVIGGTYLVEVVGGEAFTWLGVPILINPHAPGPASLSCMKTQIAEITGHMIDMWAEVHKELRSWVDPVAA